MRRLSVGLRNSKVRYIYEFGLQSIHELTLIVDIFNGALGKKDEEIESLKTELTQLQEDVQEYSKYAVSEHEAQLKKLRDELDAVKAFQIEDTQYHDESRKDWSSSNGSCW
jgi:chromosome segregation ATPase